MKQLSILLVSLLFTGSVFSLPLSSEKDTEEPEHVFVVDIIRCAAATLIDGCGSNPAATDPLTQGSLSVSASGKVTVRLDGAAPNTTYTVFVGNWVTGGGFQAQFNGTGADCVVTSAIGTVTTDTNGDFKGAITTAEQSDFVFPVGTAIGQVNFAFNNSPVCGPTQFTTGLSVSGGD